MKLGNLTCPTNLGTDRNYLINNLRINSTNIEPKYVVTYQPKELNPVPCLGIARLRQSKGCGLFILKLSS